MGSIEGKSAKEWFDIGYKTNNINEKIKAYDNAIRLNPDDAFAYNNRGSAYNNKKQYDLAIADYNKVIQINPNYALAYNNRGLAYKNKGRYDLAIADYSKAIQFNPDYALAYNNRGLAYKNKGHYDLAIIDYNKAIQLKPDYVDAYNNRGLAYYYKGQYTLAITDYNKAIQINPDYAFAYNNRGITYGNLNKWQEQIADFEKILSLGVDSSSKTKNGKLKTDYEKWIKEAKKKLSEQIEIEKNIKTEIEVKLKIETKVKEEAKLKAELEKLQAEKKRLTAEYNASRVVKRFDRSVLKYLHRDDESNMLCQIPEWAERIASNTGLTDDNWIKIVKISRNVTIIENDAFLSCPNLEWVDFSEAAALKIIEKNAFATCDKLKRVSVPLNCKVEKRAFPKKCKIEKISVKVNIQPVYPDINLNMPIAPIVSPKMRENMKFDSLNESTIFGADIIASDVLEVRETLKYVQPSMVTAPLSDTTIKGGYGDSIL